MLTTPAAARLARIIQAGRKASLYRSKYANILNFIAFQLRIRRSAEPKFLTTVLVLGRQSGTSLAAHDIPFAPVHDTIIESL